MHINIAWASSTFRIIPPKDINMGTIGINDYETGYKEKIRATVLLAQNSDNAWKIMVKTNDNNMGVIGDYTKPIGDLKWKAGGSTATQLTYTNLANYDIEAARGPQSGSSNLIYIDYRIALAWQNDAPGVYNIHIVYTMTTQ